MMLEEQVWPLRKWARLCCCVRSRQDATVEVNVGKELDRVDTTLGSWQVLWRGAANGQR